MQHDILISDSQLWSAYWAPSFREAASATLRSHKTCPNLDLQLCNTRAPYYGSSRTYPASLVDVGRVRRAGPESSIHRLVDVCVWMHQWRRPIRFFPTPYLTLWSAECLSCQCLDVRSGLRHLPIRELGTPSRLQRFKSGGEAAHHVTAVVIGYHPDGI
jgi:hypothetical protein